MTITQAQLENKYQMMPDPKTVSYSQRSGNTWGTAADIGYFEKRNPKWSELQSHQQFIGQTTLVWHAWRVPFREVMGSTAKPKKGDHITFDGELWVVQTVAEELLGNRFRLFCTKGKL